MINRNARQNEQDYTDTRRQAHKIWKLLIITMKQRIFYQEVNSIRKGFQPQTLLITDKEGNIVAAKKKSCKCGLNIMRCTLYCRMEQTVAVEECGQSAYKLQNHMLSHQMM